MIGNDIWEWHHKKNKLMESAVRYAEFLLPKPVFGEIKYFQSTGQEIQTNFYDEDVRGIFIQTIYWVPTDSGTKIDFLDRNNLPLFSTVDKFEVPNYAPLLIVDEGAKVKISCSLVGISFSIALQKIF